MYQVVKVLNNNGIVAIEQESGTEYVFMGKGIGFHNKEHATFSSLEGAKKYKLEPDATSKTAAKTQLVQQVMDDLELTLGKKLNKESLSYTRLVTHLKYMITRVVKKEELKVDMSGYIRAEFPYAYQVADEICKKLENELNTTFSEIEVGYLAIHIERVRV